MTTATAGRRISPAEGHALAMAAYRARRDAEDGPGRWSTRIGVRRSGRTTKAQRQQFARQVQSEQLKRDRRAEAHQLPRHTVRPGARPMVWFGNARFNR